MTGFKTGEICDGRSRMTVFGDDDAALDPVSETVVGGFCHLPRRFSDRHQNDTTRKALILERAEHCTLRQDGADGALHNAHAVLFQSGVHKEPPFAGAAVV